MGAVSRQGIRLLWISFATAACVSVAAPAAATDTVFSFEVDRFEVTGNLPGSLFDEFDDGVVAPWDNFLGTASESGGVLTLSSPGTHDEVYAELLGLVLDRSDVLAPAAFDVQAGAGDFEVVVRWSPILPITPSGFYGLVLNYTALSGSQVSVAAAMGNFNPDVALSWGVLPGLVLGTGKTQFTCPGPNCTAHDFDVDSHQLDALDVTGDVLFRLDYDDSARIVTPGYSTDGGSTWIEPFPAHDVSDWPAASIANFGLIADPPFPADGELGECEQTPDSGCDALSRAKLRIDDAADDDKDKLSFKSSGGTPTFLPADEELDFCLYVGGELAAVFALPGAPVGGGVWKRRGQKQSFKDRSARYDGVTKALFKASSDPADPRRPKVLVKGKGGTLPDFILPLDDPLDLVLQVRDRNADCWETAFDQDDVRTNSVERVDLRNE